MVPNRAMHHIFSHFNNEFKEILDHHALIKQTKLFGNTKPHVSKIIRKEIMKRSLLKNNANKTDSKEDLKLYKIQRHVVTKLNKNLKKRYFKEKLPKGKIVKDFWNYCIYKSICNDEPIILAETEKFWGKMLKFIKRLTITLLILEINWIFITGKRMYPITRNK